MRTRLEIVSKLVENKHITFEEGMMLMEPVKHPLNFPVHPFTPSPGQTIKTPFEIYCTSEGVTGTTHRGGPSEKLEREYCSK